VRDEATAQEVDPGRAWRRWSVRARVLASVVAVSVLGMVVTGGTAYLIQDRLVSARVTESLEQEVAEFRTLAVEGIDPESGLPFSSVERLLRVVLQRNVPDRNETYLTILDGEPLEFDGGSRPIRLEDEPKVLAAAGDRNAVKFSLGGSRISLGSAMDGGEVRLWVADEGAGLDRSEIEHVFGRFGRASSGRGVDGSGLGLSIVSAIAQAHGGRVEVETAVGAGSTFTVLVPDQAAAEPEPLERPTLLDDLLSGAPEHPGRQSHTVGEGHP
jgi:hypothetical protein